MSLTPETRCRARPACVLLALSVDHDLCRPPPTALEKVDIRNNGRGGQEPPRTRSLVTGVVERIGEVPPGARPAVAGERRNRRTHIMTPTQTG